MKSSVSILLVEDEAIAAMTLRMILKKAGYTDCHVVATGEAAIASVEQDPPDIILMDVRLAGKLTGIEAAQHVHVSYHIPIIFMTGYSDQELMDQIDALNPIDVFTKPFHIPELLSIIDLTFK
jgi:two-component system, response regulator PdtaR